MVSRGKKGGPGLSRRAIVLLTLVAANSVACTGVVWAQDSGRTLKPGSASQQSAESSVIPGRYIVVLEDEGGGETAAWASVNRQQAGQVASDLSEDDEVEEVTQTYGAALKGFAAEIPAGKVDDVRSDPRVAFVAEDREVHASAQTLPTGVDRVDADLDLNSVDAGNGSGTVDADIAILDSGIYTKHPDLNVAGGKDCSRDGKNTFSDDDGHGSHVAGSAAAKDNANRGRGHGAGGAPVGSQGAQGRRVRQLVRHHMRYRLGHPKSRHTGGGQHEPRRQDHQERHRRRRQVRAQEPRSGA